MSKHKCIRKIIYFDKETISNILQEQNKGSKLVEKGVSISTSLSTEAGIESKIKLEIPFFERLSFLFTAKLRASAIVKKDSSTTITSTEISEFETLKGEFEEISETMVCDIENSSTFFRVAGGYLNIVKGGVEGVDTKEFMTVMDSFDGYDTYKIDSKRYVRFNNTAFVSNYKRNDLLATKMTLYCIKVGEFSKEKFDFMKQLKKMENLITDIDTTKKLSDVFPPKEEYLNNIEKDEKVYINTELPLIKLYDVVYACIYKDDYDEKL